MGPSPGQVELKDYKTSRSWVPAPGRSNPKTIKLVDHGSEPRAGQTQRLKLVDHGSKPRAGRTQRL